MTVVKASTRCLAVIQQDDAGPEQADEDLESVGEEEVKLLLCGWTAVRLIRCNVKHAVPLGGTLGVT